MSEPLHSTYPRSTPREYHVETTWKRSFPRRFNVESTRCVLRVPTGTKASRFSVVASYSHMDGSNFAKVAYELDLQLLTPIWVGILGVRFEVWGGGYNYPPCLKLVRIWYVSTHSHVVSGNIPFIT